MEAPRIPAADDWIAYVLLYRDIELASDEKVIKELGNEQRADYTQALVACSVNRRMIAACPLAFGEVGVKERVKSVMNYKKPAFWIVVAAIIVCVVVALCFLTDPTASPEFAIDRPIAISNPEMTFPGLAFGETQLDSKWIEVTDPYATLEYQLTYSSAAIILEIGLLAEDGTEYAHTIEDGSGNGMIENIPMGKYQLFVRNIGYQNDLPGKAVSSGAMVCELVGGTTRDTPYDPSKTIWNLTAEKLVTTPDEIGDYWLWTNSTKITVSVNQNTDFSGKVMLWTTENLSDGDLADLPGGILRPAQ